MAATKSSRRAVLRQAYELGGFVRIKMEHRQGGQRSGWEVRLPTRDEAGLRKLQRALRELGFDYGAPYVKARRRIIPLYGKEQVERFLKLIRPAVKQRMPRMPDRRDMRFKGKPLREHGRRGRRGQRRGR